MKQKRHQKILGIISETEITTQEQLTEELQRSGFLVTQATVSRDIKELRLAKVPSANGYRYSVPSVSGESGSEQITMFKGAVTGISYAMHTIVIRTYPGMAQAVAASLDSIIGNEILGSIAGDDTILIICSSVEEAQGMTLRLCKMYKWKDEA